MKKFFLVIGFFSLLLLATGCGKSIIGKWKYVDEKSEYYYIFNENNTCSYEMSIARLECTYKDDGKRLTITYNGSTQTKIYEYRFEKNNLIIKDDNGKDNKFVKEK